MTESFIQNNFAERIGGKNFGKTNTTYKFIKIKQAKEQVKKTKPSITLIDLGVGEPDAMAFPQIVKSLQIEAAKPENRIYTDNGSIAFNQAAAQFMRRVFGVIVDPDTEVLHCLGIKAALTILPACFINSGDVVFMTNPGYSIFGVHSEFYGAELVNLPLLEENSFLPNLESVSKDKLKKAKVLVLNYPNNPTGGSATYQFFEKAVTWAKKHNIVIIQDAAYSALVFGEKPLSILQIPGAKDVAVELHSMSKSFNMTGWRFGWVCGNPLIIKAYGEVKSKTDSGQFLAIQKAAITALNDLSIIKDIAAKYARRIELLVNALRQVGFKIQKPNAGFFCYCKSPKSAVCNGEIYNFSSGEDFSQWLIHHELISTVPWDEAGAHVRFSATFDAPTLEQERQVVEEVIKRLQKYKFEF